MTKPQPVDEPIENMVSEGSPADKDPDSAAAELAAITADFEARRDADKASEKVPDGITVPFRVEATAPGTPQFPLDHGLYSGQTAPWLDQLRELLAAEGHKVAEEGPLVEADAKAIEAQLAQAGRDVESAFRLGVEDWKALWRSLLS